MTSLMNDTTLTFTRYGEQVLDDSGSITTGVGTEFTTQGSLQPFRLGDMQEIGLEGRKTKDFRRFYTRTKLNNADPHQQTQADSCVIGGQVFEVYDNGDWATTSMFPSMIHYKAILVKREEGGA
jgi:hypothetical protein